MAGPNKAAKACARGQHGVSPQSKAAQCCVKAVIQTLLALLAEVGKARGPSLPLRPCGQRVRGRGHDGVAALPHGRPKACVDGIPNRPRQVSHHIILGCKQSWVHNQNNTVIAHIGQSVRHAVGLNGQSRGIGICQRRVQAFANGQGVASRACYIQKPYDFAASQQRQRVARACERYRPRIATDHARVDDDRVTARASGVNAIALCAENRAGVCNARVVA